MARHDNYNAGEHTPLLTGPTSHAMGASAQVTAANLTSTGGNRNTLPSILYDVCLQCGKALHHCCCGYQWLLTDAWTRLAAGGCAHSWLRSCPSLTQGEHFVTGSACLFDPCRLHHRLNAAHGREGPAADTPLLWCPALAAVALALRSLLQFGHVARCLMFVTTLQVLSLLHESQGLLLL